MVAGIALITPDADHSTSRFGPTFYDEDGMEDREQGWYLPQDLMDAITEAGAHKTPVMDSNAKKAQVIKRIVEADIIRDPSPQQCKTWWLDDENVNFKRQILEFLAEQHGEALNEAGPSHVENQRAHTESEPVLLEAEQDQAECSHARSESSPGVIGDGRRPTNIVMPRAGRGAVVWEKMIEQLDQRASDGANQ